MFAVIFQLIVQNISEKLEEHLRQNPKDVELRHEGLSTLCFAIKQNATNSFRTLLKNGARPNLKEMGYMNNNALLHAVSRNNAECTTILLNLFKFKHGPGPLLETAFLNDSKTVFKAIIAAYPEIGKNQAAVGYYNDPPIEYAIRQKALQCLTHFLSFFSSHPSTLIDNAGSPFMFAIRELNFTAVQLIAKATHNLKEALSNPKTATLHEASYTKATTFKELQEKRKIIKLLLKYISPNTKDSDQNTPLHLVSDTETARFLVETGAVLNVKNRNGKLPSKNQIEEGNTAMATWLQLMEEAERENKK